MGSSKVLVAGDKRRRNEPHGLTILYSADWGNEGRTGERDPGKGERGKREGKRWEAGEFSTKYERNIASRAKEKVEKVMGIFIGVIKKLNSGKAIKKTILSLFELVCI